MRAEHWVMIGLAVSLAMGGCQTRGAIKGSTIYACSLPRETPDDPLWKYETEHGSGPTVDDAMDAARLSVFAAFALRVETEAYARIAILRKNGTEILVNEKDLKAHIGGLKQVDLPLRSDVCAEADGKFGVWRRGRMPTSEFNRAVASIVDPVVRKDQHQREID